MRLRIEAGNACVCIADGVIVAEAGEPCMTVRLPEGHIRPGLINAHDHLHRNHYGRLGSPPYANAYDWARDIQTRHATEIARGRSVPRRRALLAGAWKNLLSGVTHVVHHDRWEDDFDRDFPINVVRLDTADSLGMTPDLAPRAGAPFALHVAEGVDEAAAREVETLHARGLLDRDLLAVHAVGPDRDGVARMRASGCAVVWCPTSNRYLFGRTAPDALLADGMDVLLGTDSLLTGAGTLLDELRAARRTISDTRLLDAVGALAAGRLGMAAPSLAPGAPADLAVFARSPLESGRADVLLVIAGGELRVLRPDLATALGVRGGRTTGASDGACWISEGEPLP
jgi:cytosine/adenosine deaminase-related metal-dependent hydrolase